VELGFVDLAVNLGYAHDTGEVLENLPAGGAVRIGAAVQVPWRRLVLGSLELLAVSPADDLFGRQETTAIELSIGGRVHLSGGMYAAVGAATTLSSGFGVPSWRSTVALGWAPRGLEGETRPPPGETSDLDSDGVPDVSDQCPEVREDHDGFEDSDGCIDPDNDGDGIEDQDDGAPFAPEDKDGFEDEDGIPDPDNDLDGVPDERDSAPLLPEDWDGEEDDDGVPE
jgi:large repetitive protein